MPVTPATPSVSVVLPVRDGALFVAHAVKSILGQTFPDFELLVIDDGSQDATPALLDRLAASDVRLRVLTQPPLGLAAALNRGLEEARATFVARMDADDIAAPERLALQVAALSGRPEVAALGSACRIIDRGGRVLGHRHAPTGSDEIRRLLCRANCMIHPTMMLRRDLVMRAGGYRSAFRFCEDFDLWLRLSEHHDLLNLPEALLDYREHEAQLTWQNLEERAICELAALTLAARRRAGFADGTDENNRIDREFLLNGGVSELDISERVIASMLSTAAEAINAGLVSLAREAIELALRQPSLNFRTRLRYRLLLLRSYFNLRQLRRPLLRQPI